MTGETWPGIVMGTVFAAVLSACGQGAVAEDLEASETALSLGDGRHVEKILKADGTAGVVVRDRKGHWFELALDAEGGIALQPSTTPPEHARRPDMLPDGEVSLGTGSIKVAWLVSPTPRYTHGVIGDAVEASGLAVETAGGDVLVYRLGDDAVFEDRMARIVDVDGDGIDETLIVKSYLETGATVALVGMRDGKLVALAEAEPVGRPNRWLNPVGVADFDGDGRKEVAVVRTPHIGGILMLYDWQGDRLVEEARADGFSNHSIGSRELGWSAILDANGDGIADLVVPDAAHENFRVVSFAGGGVSELAEIPLAAGLRSALLSADLDGDGAEEVVYGTDDGFIRIVTFGRP